MVFAQLNGWTMPVAGEGGERREEILGASDPSFCNKPRRDESSRVRAWTLPLVCVDPKEADTWEALLTGQFHAFPCNDDAWSTTGIGPQSADVYAVVNAGPGQAKFGRGYLDVTSITWAADLPEGKWAVFYWRGGPGAWEAIQVRSDGTKWLDGVPGAHATTELTVSGGAVNISGPIDIDDVVFLPFFPSDSYVLAAYAWSAAGNPFSAAPRLVLDGDIVANKPVVVESVTPDQAYAPSGVYGGAGLVADYRTVTAELETARALERRRVWRPDHGWRLDSRYLESGVFTPFAGGAPGTLVNGSVVGGPYGFGEAYNFPNGAHYVEVDDSANDALNGASRFSVAAWVRRASTGAQQTIFDMETDSGTVSRLLFNFQADDSVRILIRDGGGVTAARSINVGSLTDTAEFHLVAATVDLIDDFARVFIDGISVGTGSLGVAFSTMQGTSGPDNRIGSNASGGFTLAGDIAKVGLYLSRVPDDAWLEMFELGKEGVFV